MTEHYSASDVLGPAPRVRLLQPPIAQTPRTGALNHMTYLCPLCHKPITPDAEGLIATHSLGGLQCPESGRPFPE